MCAFSSCIRGELDLGRRLRFFGVVCLHEKRSVFDIHGSGIDGSVCAAPDGFRSRRPQGGLDSQQLRLGPI